MNFAFAILFFSPFLIISNIKLVFSAAAATTHHRPMGYDYCNSGMHLCQALKDWVIIIINLCPTFFIDRDSKKLADIFMVLADHLVYLMTVSI